MPVSEFSDTAEGSISGMTAERGTVFSKMHSTVDVVISRRNGFGICVCGLANAVD